MIADRIWGTYWVSNLPLAILSCFSMVRKTHYTYFQRRRRQRMNSRRRGLERPTLPRHSRISMGPLKPASRADLLN